MKISLFPFGDVFAILVVIFFILSLSVGSNSSLDSAKPQLLPFAIDVGHKDSIGIANHELIAVGINGAYKWVNSDHLISKSNLDLLFRKLFEDAEVIAVRAWELVIST